MSKLMDSTIYAAAAKASAVEFLQGWKIFEMGSELFLRNFGLPSFRSKYKA